MLLTITLASIMWQYLGVTVVVCDAPWLKREVLEQMLGAEILEIPEAERSELVLIVDECTETAARLRATGTQAPRSRTLEIGDIPEEARVRTLAIALGELARERLPVVETVVTPPPDTDTKPEALPVKPPPEEPHSDGASENKENHLFSLGAHFRAFPLARTMAPEVRLGLRAESWQISGGGYAMGWTDDLGTVYLAAVTFLAGPTLVAREYTQVTIGLDALLELGAVMAIGDANEDVDHSPKFNVAAGGHLSFWMGFRPGQLFRPTIALDVGWVRGLNVFSGEDHLGGFEGLSAVVGIAGAWCVKDVSSH